MKHTFGVTFFLLLLFLLAQFIGLIIVDYYSENSLPMNIERPDLNPATSYITIFIIILISTVIALLLLKFKLYWLWRSWFFLSVFITLIISFNVFVSFILSLIMALVFAVWRIFWPNPIVHNLTELFIYGALAAMFVPLFNLWSILILLVLISVYDYISVRKTEHMVKLAKSQGEAKVFAGLLIPYDKNVAMLGGGDIGFSLMFSGVCMTTFNLSLFDIRTYIVPLFVTMMLFFLFWKGEKKKFYPAMPYITLGCVLGLLVLLFFI